MADEPKPRRHAPKGPLIHRDPIREQDPIRCKAHSRTGKQCGNKPIPGGAVCRHHGGGAPQVKQAALARLMALQHPAIDRLSQLIDQTEFPTVAYAASRDVLDRTIGKPSETQQHEHRGTIVLKHEL